MITTRPEALFSMIEGFAPLTNLLGAGDPNVHWIEDRWWMFFGGFQSTFKNNIFAACLDKGEPLREGMRWRICTYPNGPRRAMPLVAQPAAGQWDRYGLHEPSFAEGATTGRDSRPHLRRRIYYTGRGSRKVLGNVAPYSIGVLELTPAGWRRHPRPVLTGTEENPSALGPKVVYSERKWRMWFRATTGEPAKGERPVAEIRYTESEDGVSGWSEPTPFYPRQEGFAHAFVHRAPGGFEMLLSKSPNLYGQKSYPDQGLWISTASRASGDVADWSEPRPLLVADSGPPWYRGGFFGSSLCVPDTAPTAFDDRVVFFTGVHTPINWPRTALQRIVARRMPPVPAPYYFTIGTFRTTV